MENFNEESRSSHTKYNFISCRFRTPLKILYISNFNKSHSRSHGSDIWCSLETFRFFLILLMYSVQHKRRKDNVCFELWNGSKTHYLSWSLQIIRISFLIGCRFTPEIFLSSKFPNCFNKMTAYRNRVILMTSVRVLASFTATATRKTISIDLTIYSV